jgi:putative transposase
VIWAGARVGVNRRRVRAVGGSGEWAIPADVLFSSTEVLGRMALERMLAELSTRRYHHGFGTGRGAGRHLGVVDREFGGLAQVVKITETALAELLAADLSGTCVVGGELGPA